MDTYLINGGNKLFGKLQVDSAKNGSDVKIWNNEHIFFC